MNLNFRKLKLPKFDLKKAASADPRKLWPGFLWVLIFFAIIVAVSNVWLYFYFSKSGSETGQIDTLKTLSLDKALERIVAKRDRFETYQNGPMVEDPS